MATEDKPQDENCTCVGFHTGACDSFVGDGLTASPYKEALAALEAEKETVCNVYMRDPKDIRRIQDLENYIQMLEHELHIHHYSD